MDPDTDYSREPQTLVEFRPEPTDTGTRLTISESGFSALPEGRRLEALRSNDGGWAERADNVRRHVEA